MMLRKTKVEGEGTTEDEMDGITNSMDVRFSKFQELMMVGRPGVLQSLESQRVRHD